MKATTKQIAPSDDVINNAKKLAKLPLDLIGRAIASVPAKRLIADNEWQFSTLSKRGA